MLVLHVHAPTDGTQVPALLEFIRDVGKSASATQNSGHPYVGCKATNTAGKWHATKQG